MQTHDKLDEYLKTLTLPWIRQNYKLEVENAAKAKLSYAEFLFKIMQEEVISKLDRSINRRVQTAGFPQIKHFESFDFSFQPKIDEKLLRELTQLQFMDEAKNIIFLEPPGVGKTHLAISIGIKACQQRKRVAFYTTEQLMKAFAEAEMIGQLQRLLNTLDRLDLLIIDELGYLELTKKTASFFFRLIAARYERKSTIITSNKSFDKWGDIFQDDVVASAILDRLLHHCYPFFINGKSFRVKDIINK